MRKKILLLLAILFPILALLILTFYKKHILSKGQTLILSVKPYDPRSFLYGYYLHYTVDYGLNPSEICNSTSIKKTSHQKAYICLDPLKFYYEKIDFCKIMIKGECRYRRFEAGIEKYYLPKKEAKYWEKIIRRMSSENSSSNTQVVISVIANGSAQVKDFLVDGKSIKKITVP